MYVGIYLHLIGGKIYPYYYYYYTRVLRYYFGLNPTTVFNQIKNLTKKGTTWYDKKITVKLAISNRKITNTEITNYIKK